MWLTRTHLLAMCSAGWMAGCREPTGDSGEVQLRWRQPQNGMSQSRPAAAGDLVYFGTGEGRVVARDRTTGAARWGVPVFSGSAVEGRRILVRGDVVVVAGSHETAGIGAATGQVLWRYQAPADTVDAPAMPSPGQVMATEPAADGETVFIPAWGASVGAVALRTGQLRWSWTPGRSAGDTSASGVFRSGAEGVAVSGDTVYVTAWHCVVRLCARSEGWLVALAAGTGAELWRVRVPSTASARVLVGAPAVRGRLVLFTTREGRLLAYDRFTAARAWEVVAPAEFSALTAVALAGDVAYFDGGDRRLYAVRVADGTVLWRAAVGNGATRDLLVTDRYVYFPSFGSLVLVQRATGRVAATLRVPSSQTQAFESAPTFSEGSVFVHVTDGAWAVAGR
jgi:outer membrane protein assembly factor BamB